MLDDIRKLLKEYYGINKCELNSDIRKDFDLTSFDIVGLICLIEEKYNVEIDEDMYRELITVGDLINYLETK
jgi:acyl carrier protein